MIYSIRHKDSTRLSYIHGTVHVRDQRVFLYAENAKFFMKKCNAYFGEINLAHADYAKMSHSFLMKPEYHYDVYFNEKKYCKYKTIANKYFNQNLDTLKSFYPLYAINALLQSRLNQDKAEPLDYYYFKLACELNLELDGLESFDLQCSIPALLDINVQMSRLKHFFSQFTTYSRSIDHMIDLYAQGDITMLYRMSKKSLGSFRMIMLYNRNGAMSQKIIESTKEQSCFITVGCGHLGGNKGILALLKKSNCVIEKVI